MECLTHDPVLGHISTFGGHPLSCAASLATLLALEKEGLLTFVEEKALLLQNVWLMLLFRKLGVVDY